MSWRVAGSLLTLRDQVTALFPNRDHGADGTIGDTAHQAEVSDHNPDAAGVVRALDLDADTNNATIPNLNNWIGERLRQARDPRLKYHINNGRIFYGNGPNDEGAASWAWVTYYGDDGHYNHNHTSVAPNATADNTSPWSLAAGGDPEEAELVTAADKIIEAVKADNKATAAGMRTWTMNYLNAKFGGTINRVVAIAADVKQLADRVAALEARQPPPGK